jgi:hypothetical protein
MRDSTILQCASDDRSSYVVHTVKLFVDQYQRFDMRFPFTRIMKNALADWLGESKSCLYTHQEFGNIVWS